jgi:hypothetical protein
MDLFGEYFSIVNSTIVYIFLENLPNVLCGKTEK